MESRKEERQETFRPEGDAQGTHHPEAQRDFSHERKEVPATAQTPVSTIKDFQRILDNTYKTYNNINIRHYEIME